METTNRNQGEPEGGVERVSVREWLHRWLAEVIKVERSGGTYDRYKDIVRRQLNPYIGDVPLAELSALQIRSMERALIEEGLSTSTAGLVHSVISGACRYAVQLEIIDKNPASVFPAPKPDTQEVEPPEIAQVKDLLALAREEEHFLFAYLHVTTYTAMRRGEGIALRWHNVHLDQRYLHICESAVKERGKGMVVKRPKTPKSRRNVDIDRSTGDVLRQQRERHDEAGMPTELVFPDRKGRLLKPTTLDREIKALAKRAGLLEFNMHLLRHFHASVALRRNPNDLAVVSRRLGHSSLATTADIYGHLLSGWQREVADAFAQEMESD